MRVKCKNILYGCAVTCLVFLCISITNYDANLVRLPAESRPRRPLVRVYDDSDTDRVRSQVASMLDKLPGFAEQDCDALISGADEATTNKSAAWKVFPAASKVWDLIDNAPDQCQALRTFYVFPNRAFSDEEAAFPLAYGAIVHKHIYQVSYMISSLYQPQNVFAIVVDGKATEDFKRRVNILGDCFKNIHVIHSTKIGWCSYEIVRGVFNSVKYLSQLSHPWRYFQYLSGVDLPLKTNLEMVRIFKQLDGAFMSEISDFQNKRLKNNTRKSPVNLYKASLSAAFSRESADFMVNSPVVGDLLSYLKNTNCPDESIWASIAGNPDAIPIPGGFDGRQLLAVKKAEMAHARRHPDDSLPFFPHPPGPGETFRPSQYYLPRFQVWKGSAKCHGSFVAASCVFGVRDLPQLVKRPEIVVHKLYFNFQPATYFCLLKNHWQRALNFSQQRQFDARSYSKLAQVELLHGKPFEQLRFYSADN